MEPRACSWRDFVWRGNSVHPTGSLESGRCFAFVSHSFSPNLPPIAAAVVEDHKSGEIVIVPAVCVRFTIPGNEDKR